MNSITYLDSLLSRSLQGTPRHSRRPSSSGSGSGARHSDAEVGNRRTRRTASSGTSAAASLSDDKERTEVLQEALGSQSGKVTRRASDYSLRRGEKERRKAALVLGLGLTPARPPSHVADPEQDVSAPAAAREQTSVNSSSNENLTSHAIEEGRPSSNRSDRQSASEGAHERRSLDENGRPALPRRSFRPAGPTRWATLWGLPISGWLVSASRSSEDSRKGGRSGGAGADQEGKDDVNTVRGLARRASSGSLHLGRWRAELEMEAELRADAFAGLGFSEAEAEDVVDFEGGEPESEDDAPTAPPVTPAAGSLSPGPSHQQQRSRRVSSQNLAGHGARREGSESARLASFLFGALASRVDDYFGPQPSQPLARHSPPTTPSASPNSSPLRARRVKKDTSASNLVPVAPSQESSSAQVAEEQKPREAQILGKAPGPDEPALVDTNALTEAGSPDDPKVLPLPPISQLAKAAHVNGTVGAESLDSAQAAAVADVGPTEPLDPPPPYSPPVESPSPAIASRPLSTLRRGFGALKRALNALRRAILALLLLPYHLVRQGWMRIRRRRRDAGTYRVAEDLVPVLAYDSTAAKDGLRSESGREKKISFTEHGKPERRSSGKQRAQDSEPGSRPPTPGVKSRRRRRETDANASSSSGDDSSSGEEPVTEDQAAAKAARRAERLAKRAAEAAEEERILALAITASSNQQNDQSAPLVSEKAEGSVTATRSSRLLPNPHPVDPMLAKDPKAKKVSGRHPNLDIEKSAAAASSATSPSRNPSTVIHHTPKVLVLDLDETLIHSTSRSPTWQALRAANGARGGRPASISTGGSLLGLEGLGSMLGLGERGVRPHQVEVILDGRSVIYHVYKRPYVDYFLRKVASWYHVVIFTASVQEYADPVIDWLDQGRGLVGRRLFREACTFRNGSYLKDLNIVDPDLSRVCLVDNSPASYLINPANGIPIEGWTNDPNDECLLDLLPLLDALRFASDVRNVLSIRGF